jgi:membrane-associated phospholipid phosphatase
MAYTLVMQTQILMFFHNHATPFLDVLAEFLTMFGESTLVVLIAIMIYWCIDKKKGFAISMVLVTSLAGMNIIKTIVRIPRPFTVIEGLGGKRLETATGYSFPSGHTTTATTFYGSIAKAFKKKPLSIVCIILIALIGLSRLYLCVHWPTDVLGGLVLGTLMVLFAYPLFLKMDTFQKGTTLPLIGIVSGVASLFMAILLSAGKVEAIAFSDLMKNLAICFGCFCGAGLETRYIGFSVEGTTKKKVVRYLIGVVGVLIVLAIKAIIPASLYYPGAFFRYALLGFWVTFFYPLLGVKWNLFTKEAPASSPDTIFR